MRRAWTHRVFVFPLALAAAGSCLGEMSGPALAPQRLALLALQPASAAVMARSAPLPLTASLSGGATGPVVWSLSPGIGRLSTQTGATCSYTPPPALDEEVAVEVTARAGGASAVARIIVKPLREPASYLGPAISVDLPEAGAMLSAGTEGLSPVAIRGKACDAVHSLTSMRIGQADVALAGGEPCRAFEGQWESRWGLSVVEGKAVNDAGEVGTLAHAFLRSPSWFAADSGDPAARAPSGLLLQLGQEFFDDGDRSTPNDLATLAERAIAGTDLDAAIGDSRFAQPDANGDGETDTETYDCLITTVTNRRTGFTARKNGAFTHDGIAVDRLALEDGGLVARITVRSPRVPFSITGYLDSGCLGDAQKTATGAVKAASIQLEGHASTAIDGQGQPQVSFSSITAALSGLEIDIDLGALIDWTGLGDAIGDAIARQVQGTLQDAIARAMKGALDRQLSSMLASMASFPGKSLTLPPALGGAELILESGIDRLDFKARQAVIGLFTKIRPAKPSAAHQGTRGAIRMGAALPDPAALRGSSLAVAAADDVLNQLLHAAWLAGAFDAEDLLSRFSIPGLPKMRVAISSSLPPVVMPRSDGAEGIDIGWGGIRFAAQMESKSNAAGDVARAKGVLSIVLPLERFAIAADGRGAEPVFGANPQVTVQVDEVDWDHRPTSRRAFAELLQALLRSALAGLSSSTVGPFPLPDATFADLVPSLGKLRFSLGDARSLRLGRYQALAGQIKAEK
jgi:hypothetical protein